MEFVYTIKNALKDIEDAFTGRDIYPEHCRAVMETALSKLKDASINTGVGFVERDNGIGFVDHRPLSKEKPFSNLAAESCDCGKPYCIVCNPDPKPDRIAELREKHRHLPILLLKRDDIEDAQGKAELYNKKYNDAVADINELLEMLEAKDD